MELLRFLVVEFPSKQFVFCRFTTAHPQSSIDVVLGPSVFREGDRFHPAVFLVQGVPWRDMQTLLDELARTHGPATLLRRDAVGLDWLCQVEFREGLLGSDAKALQKFQDQFGAPWLHHREGVFHLRARLPNDIDTEHLVRQLATFLEQTGVQAQVDVLDLSPQDYGVWEDLLRVSQGLASPA